MVTRPSGGVMSDDKHKTKIIVREQKHIHTGRSKGGSEYTVYQVVATRENGTPIDLNLRSFDVLPKNEVIEVTVEKFTSENFGESYTVKPVGKHSGGLGASVDELRTRVDKLEGVVGEMLRGDSQQGPPPPPPPSPERERDPDRPMAQPMARGHSRPVEVGDKLPSDDDIPF